MTIRYLLQNRSARSLALRRRFKPVNTAHRHQNGSKRSKQGQRQALLSGLKKVTGYCGLGTDMSANRARSKAVGLSSSRFGWSLGGASSPGFVSRSMTHETSVLGLLRATSLTRNLRQKTFDILITVAIQIRNLFEPLIAGRDVSTHVQFT